MNLEGEPELVAHVDDTCNRRGLDAETAQAKLDLAGRHQSGTGAPHVRRTIQPGGALPAKDGKHARRCGGPALPSTRQAKQEMA